MQPAYNLSCKQVAQLCNIRVVMTVSDLPEQPCNKSDNALNLLQVVNSFVPNFLQHLVYSL
jgi:hypothetical protein